jgi:hypothetical protein
MDVEIFLIVVVPAIVIGTVLYAVVSEMRHSSVRRNRWDLRTSFPRGRRPGVDGWKLADAGRE